VSAAAMSDMHKVIAGVRDAIESSRDAIAHGEAPIPPPEIARAESGVVEMVAGFARELHAVGGQFLGSIDPAELAASVVSYAEQIGARSIAIGAGITFDTELIGEKIERAGLTVIKAVPVADIERAAMRERIARCDLAIAEADCAIASTGTLAVIGNRDRANSLTLIPPASFIFVQASKMFPDMASALDALGPASIAAARLTLITGPSRTADIEKRIVLGIHGPKSLAVAVLWPRESAR
jgi:L-lactate dehydrogenase complex protein LldG